MKLQDDIGSIKGVGPKTKGMLNSCGIYSALDLLLYFPRNYEKVYIQNESLNANTGMTILNCSVLKIDRDIRTKNNKVITTVIFKCGNNILKGKWFNQPYMKDKFMLDCSYTITGKLQDYREEKIIVNPVIINNSAIENAVDTTKDGSYKIVPKYSLKEGLTNNFFIKIINYLLKQIIISENLPDWIIKRYNFCSLQKSINNIHFPVDEDSLLEAQRRLKFQELFTYSLKLLVLKDYINRNNKGIKFSISPELKVLKEKLPYSLTNAQSRVVREILLDQKKNKQMNRLVQGDVGSGKTIVAIISMFNVVMNGYQAAIIAPTEILSNQHYNELKFILKDFNVNIELLNGSVTQKQKDKIKQDLKEGNIDIIVGTHALLQENVNFKNLGMVVTDEQHRFGVMQRSNLFNKGNGIDMLVMTATPIPRTLALYLYSDLEVSIIDELPPGRKKITTYFIDQRKKEKAYEFALKEINEGRQVYIVCPLIEDNEELNINSVEKLYMWLKNSHFKNVSCSILHGKMPNKEKDEIMNKFKNGEIKVLISTTVIEVGINVPNASLMIIENAERFGLAQLHQLRGRVGRGQAKSYCILIGNIKSDVTKKRLEIIQNNTDGFKIAEEDLKIRGSGELFGVRQHGDNNLILADLYRDSDLLIIANQEAKRLINSTEKNDTQIKIEILESIETTSKFICFN
ncbi:ATP-dependent DNA helicase RecG [Clostridiales bacterium oral taxon 876 str. F0540]|nr:ATP-dependent DNA helicase RecG [Clostridiales bacterium oral taxon 876 str. F0540]